MNSILKFLWNLVFNLTGVDLYSGAKCGDFSFFSIELRAKFQEASKLLAAKGFTPREFAPGETRLRILSLEYRDVQIAGPYNEISIEFSVDPIDDSPGDKIAHLFLPVTTEAARWPGADIMGMPKFVADIDIKKEGSQMVSRLTVDGEMVLEFSVEDKVGTRQSVTWENYGIRKRQVVQTDFDVEALVHVEETNTNAAITLGKHAISDTIRGLLLSDEIVLTMIGHEASGLLNKPVPISR